MTRGKWSTVMQPACLFLLQPIKASPILIRLHRLHLFQVLHCQGLAKTYTHQRHLPWVPSVAPEAEPVSFKCRWSLDWRELLKAFLSVKKLARGGGWIFGLEVDSTIYALRLAMFLIWASIKFQMSGVRSRWDWEERMALERYIIIGLNP